MQSSGPALREAATGHDGAAIACAAPSLWLAPMEGLLDHSLRDVLTRLGGIDLCVSEFIRVTDTVLPRRAWLRVVPELLNGSRTPAGVPVRVQLLGSDPVCLAENAASLAELAPAGIDLNFGCPAKTVNRHRGGAVLLDEPELVGRIVAQVRRAVPGHIPVSAKMRLGYLDDRRADECALAIESAGASELVVHARTKAHGYRPPAYWDRIADLRERVRMPLIANGEIWSADDARRCRQASGCERLMLGRGMVADPGLALAIRQSATPTHPMPLAPGMAVAWEKIVPLMQLYWERVSARVSPHHRAGRLKQWLHYLRRSYPQAQQAFDELRRFNEPGRIEQWLWPQPGGQAAG